MFHEWDAAYLLGALSAADRRAYEEHLASCPSCAAAVADLAGVPALLGAVPRDEALALLDEVDARSAETRTVPDLVPALAGRVRRIRLRRRWLTALVASAAAVVVAVGAMFVPSLITPVAAPTVTASLHQPAASSTRLPLTADVTLTTKKWGTSIGMVCRWTASASGGYERWDYGLWIVTAGGKAQRVATWTAGPGDVVRTTDSTSVPVADIVRIELRSSDGRTVLLAAPVRATT
ncbi:hypothetical protein LK09_01970 [Microbacterium mangrovi]|uniref:Putative zinc-finger domain-containing protein n=1 Tax=Microbacterium mangrovi TaxID=1348253 RepID=A0A0B2A926_9MICO|nr:hypothetical protein LK09_01970 [Microbacterium mangrovi]